jgi:hypothetical protein
MTCDLVCWKDQFGRRGSQKSKVIEIEPKNVLSNANMSPDLKIWKCWTDAELPFKSPFRTLNKTSRFPPILRLWSLRSGHEMKWNDEALLHRPTEKCVIEVHYLIYGKIIFKVKSSWEFLYMRNTGFALSFISFVTFYRMSQKLISIGWVCARFKSFRFPPINRIRGDMCPTSARKWWGSQLDVTSAGASKAEFQQNWLQESEIHWSGGPWFLHQNLQPVDSEGSGRSPRGWGCVCRTTLRSCSSENGDRRKAGREEIF